MSAKPLLIGEDNPHSLDPAHALYPYPEGCAGHRLCVAVMQLAPREYRARFDRTNLCASGRWNMKEARDRAAEITRYRALADGPLVLLGAKVCRAFAVPYEPFSALALDNAGQVYGPQTFRPIQLSLKMRLVVLPHPSGRCRAWNADGAYDKARAVLRTAGVL